MMRTRMTLVLGLVVACTNGNDDKDDTDTRDTDVIVDTDKPDTDDTDPDTVDTDDTDDTDTVDTDTIDTDRDTDTDATVDTDDTDDTDGPSGPLLMITEVGDYTDPNVKWVEICNPGSQAVDFAGWRIARLDIGSLTEVDSVALGGGSTLSLAPGRAHLVAYRQGTLATFTSNWQRAPNQYSDVISGGGDKVYVLTNQGQPIDVYGDPFSVPAPGAWNYTRKVAIRDIDLTQPSTFWTAADWTITSDFTQATPGRCGPGSIDTDPPDETDDELEDTWDPWGGDTYDTDPFDTSIFGPGLVVGVDDLAPGDLVINEIMVRPDACEYLTFVVTPNMSPLPDRVDLEGLVLSDQAGNTFTLEGSYRARPFEEVVAWRRPVSGVHCYIPDGYGFSYTGFDLSDGGDIVRLRNGSGIIDQVDYTGWATQDGIAWQLDVDSLDALLNDDASYWCLAITPIAGAADLGSPTFPNVSCVPPETGDTDDSDTVDTDDSDVETDRPDTDVDIVPADDLAVGNLVITEFTVKLSSPCDQDDQYLEIANNTSEHVDLGGLRVVTLGGSATIAGPAVVPPGELAVIHSGARVDHCLRDSLNVWRSFQMSPALEWSVTGDRLSLQNLARTLDAVDYRTWSPLFLDGQAWSLDDEQVDAQLNDLQENWCANGLPVGPGNIGTMGALYPCPQPTP